MNESTDTDDGRRGTLLDGPPSGDSRNHDSSHDTAHGRHSSRPVQGDSGGDVSAASAATSEGTEDENVMRHGHHGHHGGQPPLYGCHTASRPVVRHGTECEALVSVGSQSAGGTGGNDEGKVLAAYLVRLVSSRAGVATCVAWSAGWANGVRPVLVLPPMPILETRGPCPEAPLSTLAHRPWVKSWWTVWGPRSKAWSKVFVGKRTQTTKKLRPTTYNRSNEKRKCMGPGGWSVASPAGRRMNL